MKMNALMRKVGPQPELVEGVDLASHLAMRSVTINGRRTTMRLEPSMWNALQRISADNGVTVNQLCSQIDSSRGDLSMTAAVRSYIVSYLQKLPTFGESRGRALQDGELLDRLDPAYSKAELLRVRFERGEDSVTKIAIGLSVLESGEPTLLSELYREWRRRREQLERLPRITELSARLLRRAGKETLMNVVDLAAGGSIAQPHQDPVMVWSGSGIGHRPHPLIRATFQQDMLAVEFQAEPIYQIVDVRVASNQNIYKRLMLPVSDDGVEVTRVLIAALSLTEERVAAEG
jgi:predicted DNA-binding ribbon-helix-helix protein